MSHHWNRFHPAGAAFLEVLGSDKQSFTQFVIQKYREERHCQELKQACKEVRLMQNGELESGSLGELIDELDNQTH